MAKSILRNNNYFSDRCARHERVRHHSHAYSSPRQRPSSLLAGQDGPYGRRERSGGAP